MDKIDLKDRKILYELDKNARQTLSQIRKNVRLPKSVVAYRIKKLEETDIIKNFYTVINFYKLGYTNLAIYVNYQYYTPAIEKEIINHFVNSEYSWWVANIQGKYDLVVLFLIKDLNDFFSFWKKTLDEYKFYFHCDSLGCFFSRRFCRGQGSSKKLETERYYGHSLLNCGRNLAFSFSGLLFF